MGKVLFLNACIRENSRTLELAQDVLTKLSQEVEEVKLYDLNLKPVDMADLQIREAAKRENDFSNKMFDLAKQFANAEIILIAAPYWDLMFPAVVKNYFENITVSGLTFTYGANGRLSSLCNAKTLVYVTTSGGPIFCNFGYEYIESLAKNFFGINDVKFVSAQGLDIQGANVSKILNESKKQFK